MNIYKHHILALRIRSPYTPSTGGAPGTRNWGKRAAFDVPLDEQLYNEAAQESEQTAHDYECYVTGSYKDDDQGE